MTDCLEQLEGALVSLRCITLFKAACTAPLLQSYDQLLEMLCRGYFRVWEAAGEYAKLAGGLLDAGYPSLASYAADQLFYADSPVAETEAQGLPFPQRQAVQAELSALSRALSLPCPLLKAAIADRCSAALQAPIAALPEWGTGDLPDYGELQSFYRENGCGIFARARAFHWAGGTLLPIARPDPLRFSDMFGYQWQRQEVYQNTQALVKGQRVNNVLLFGDAGTGKSAVVKSMLNVPEFHRLRLVEVDKRYLQQLPDLIRLLGEKPLKFIVFIDDLSFGDGDAGYSALKIILEGGVEQRPENVAVYVTSNRRQLVKRQFDDTELDAQETVQEMTSLADRFGVRIPYMSLGRPEFLELVATLAQNAGLSIDRAVLDKKAVQWEMEHAGRTPRVARQLIDYLSAQE